MTGYGQAEGEKKVIRVDRRNSGLKSVEHPEESLGRDGRAL